VANFGAGGGNHNLHVSSWFNTVKFTDLVLAPSKVPSILLAARNESVRFPTTYFPICIGAYSRPELAATNVDQSRWIDALKLSGLGGWLGLPVQPSKGLEPK
jgi:hypothetical protein